MSTVYVKAKCDNNVITMGKGNAKLDKSIAIFSLPAGAEYTCENTCPNCYAIKAQVMYPQVLPCRLNNFEASKSENFVAVMVNLIKKHNFKVVRIHESGDFYNVAYAAKWGQIAMELPQVKFYGYTKRQFAINFFNSVKIENLNIVNSLLPDGQVNFGPIDYVKKQSKAFSIPVCPVTLKVNNAKCGKTCKLCQNKSNMLFVIH